MLNFFFLNYPVINMLDFINSKTNKLRVKLFCISFLKWFMYDNFLWVIVIMHIKNKKKRLFINFNNLSIVISAKMDIIVYELICLGVLFVHVDNDSVKTRNFRKLDKPLFIIL